MNSLIFIINRNSNQGKKETQLNQTFSISSSLANSQSIAIPILHSREKNIRHSPHFLLNPITFDKRPIFIENLILPPFLPNFEDLIHLLIKEGVSTMNEPKQTPMSL